MSQSIIHQLIQELPNKLKKSKQDAKEALDEILKIFTSPDTSDKLKTYIGLYTSSRISTSFQQTRYNFDLYFKCLKQFIPSLNCADYKKAIPYIYNFIAIGSQNEVSKMFGFAILAKDKVQSIVYFQDSKMIFRKFIPTLPDIELEHVDDIQLIDYLASIQMILLQLIHLNATTEELKYSVKKLTSIYDILYEKFQFKYIEISSKLFKYESYVKLIYNNLKHTKEFLLHYMTILKTTEIEKENLENHYMNLTKILLNFVKYDKTLTNDKNAAIFAKCLCDLFKKHEFYQYSLICYCYLLRTDSKKYILTETLAKFQKLLDLEKFEEIWFIDAVITFSQILVQSVFDTDNLTEIEFLSVFKIIKKLFEKYRVITIPKCKRTCQCGHENEHEIVILCGYSLDLLKKCIQLNFHNNEIIGVVSDLLKAIVKYKQINCKHLETHLDNILFKTYNALISLDNNNNFNKNYRSLINILIEIRTKEINNFRILKILKELHINDENVQNLLEISALLAGNIADDQSSSKCLEQAVINFIKCSLEVGRIKGASSDPREPNAILLTEVIRTSKLPETLKPKILNEECLMQKQFEVCLKYSLLSQTQSEDLTLRILKTKTKDIFQTVQLLGILKKIQSKELLLQLNEIKQEFSKKPLSSALKEENLKSLLILAVLYKIEALQEFDKLKRNTTEKITVFSEAILTDMNFGDFDNFLINIELNAIHLAELSFTYYEKFYKIFKESNLNINWTSIYDDCSVLARHLHLRGYYNLAFNFWMLVYKFATLQNCTENQIRAISYFCENFHTINEFDKNFKLREKVEKIANNTLEQYKQISNLSPRRQNYILICMLNMASFHLRENNFGTFYILKQLVLQKINNMDSRKTSFEFVKAKYYALEFELCNKRVIPKNYSSVNLITNLLNEIYQIQHITSEDTINVTTFLFEFVSHVTHYFVSISDSATVLPKLMVLFIFAYENGLINRMAAILSLWATVNLQNEKHLLCQPKLLILKNILQICKNPSRTENSVAEKKYLETASMILINDGSHLTIEPTRRQVQSLSPQFYKMPVAAYKTDLSSYLLNHNETCDCSFCKYPIIKFLFFKVGAIYARNYYYSESSLVAQSFYEKSSEWFQKHKNTHAFQHHRYELILTAVYCFNNLRVNNLSETFKTTCNQILDLLDDSNLESLEFAYYWQIIEQKFAIEYFRNDRAEKKSTNFLEMSYPEEAPPEMVSPVVSKRKLKYNEIDEVIDKTLVEGVAQMKVSRSSSKEISSPKKKVSSSSSKKKITDENPVGQVKSSNKVCKEPTKSKPCKLEKYEDKDIIKGTKVDKEKQINLPNVEKENCDTINSKCVAIKKPVIKAKVKSNLHRLDTKFESNDKASSSKPKSKTQSISTSCDNNPKRVLRSRKPHI